MSRVLIVDDSAENCYLLQALLTGMGHEVDTARDGAEALAAARSTPPDLVVSDILMPKMDGFALCRAWRADDRLAAIPFMFYTATYTEPKDEAFALGLGADCFVVKPQDPEVLAGSIAALLEKARASSSEGPGRTRVDPAFDSELDFVKKHRDRVSRKLADKMAELERANTELHRYLSEMLLAKEALRESEGRYRSLVAQSPDGIFLVDLNGRFLAVNETICRKLGFSEAEMLAKSLWEIVPESQWATHRSRLARIVSGEVLDDTVEYSVRDKNGRLVPVEVRSAPYRSHDQVVGFQGIARDITERKVADEERARLEEQLRHAQKMEAVGRLAGGVAHDFNNLLQAMLSQVELVRGRNAESEHLAAGLAEFEAQVRRGSALTRQLLLFARRETARPEPLDLNEVVDGAATLLRHLLRANIVLTIDLAREPLPVTADHGQLDQVLVNLAVNAADAMPGGGQLTIRTGREGPARVFFSVGDTGSGIAAEIRGRIFEPFFTTKESGRGTGLGLAVVDGIVRNHDGTLELESTEGEGSTFKVVLHRAAPGGRAGERAGAPILGELATGSGERILLVEDEDGTREGLRDTLIALGYQVVAVGSGDEASALAPEPAFDLLLTDLMLPGVPGPQLAASLQHRWPTLEVILMSGYAEDEVIRRGVSAGKVRFLQKPFDMATLAGEVRTALAARASGAEA